MIRKIDRLYGWQEGETALSAEIRDDRVVLRIDGAEHVFEILTIESGLVRLRDGAGGVIRVYVASAEGKAWVHLDGRVHVLERRARRRRGPAETKGTLGPVTAPMFGTVRKVLVERGASVGEGQGLLVIEAMKMELTLRAPAAARVEDVRCHEGAQVDQGTPLVILAPTEEGAESQTEETA